MARKRRRKADGDEMPRRTRKPSPDAASAVEPMTKDTAGDSRDVAHYGDECLHSNSFRHFLPTQHHGGTSVAPNGSSKTDREKDTNGVRKKSSRPLSSFPEKRKNKCIEVVPNTISPEEFWKRFISQRKPVSH